MVFSLFLIPLVSAQITETTCSIEEPCSEGLECISFPDVGLRCAQPNPCSYYECPEGTQCNLAESYPAQIICSRSCEGEECSDGDTVSYDLRTNTVEVIKDEETVSHDISLWQATVGNKGILKTATSSAKYSGEIIVEGSNLFMETSIGRKQINILPEDAAGKAEEVTTVKEIELKEELQKPVYSVKGTKQVRILFIIPVSMGIETKVDAGTGDVISVNKPFWSFLAR